jgi:hypothetical protein
MRHSFIPLAAGAAIALVVALAGSTAASAQSVMKVCGDQWKQAKAAGTTSGETWPQFLAQCRAQQKAGGAAAPASSGFAPAAVAPTPTYGQGAPTAGVKTAGECNAEYAANKAAIRASGQTKREFVAGCRAGTGLVPTASTAVPAPAPSTYNAPAPAPTNYAPAPAPAQTPAEPSYSSLPRSLSAGEFASDQQARARCPTDTVVWVNTRSRVYHFEGTHNYGHTKEGAYMCEADAKAAGDRAAMNEQHP